MNFSNTKAKSTLTLADVPEEILERILALVLVQSPDPSPRPSWHPYQTPPAAGHANVISPLLVSRAWLRIATPIHYRHPVLRTPRHVQLLLRALQHTPALAPCVRSLHVHATAPALRDLVPLCHHLRTLDITVDNADAGAGAGAPPTPMPAAESRSRDRGVIDFCDAFTKTRSIRHLVIRKNAYLTQPNAIYIFEHLADAVTRWHKLETVNVAFRLSPSPAAVALVKALAAAPRLHTLYTQLPAVWNTTLLDIAQNPALARIVLSPAHELAGAHLFLGEAKRYPRLMDLFRAGSPPPPPAPLSFSHPSHASAASSSSSYLGHPGASAFRARASSAVTATMTPMTPMPVPTWGYEREVPPPACPRRTGREVQQMAAPGTMVGPSAYAFAPVANANVGSYHCQHRPQQLSHHHPQQQQQQQQPTEYYHHHPHPHAYPTANYRVPTATVTEYYGYAAGSGHHHQTNVVVPGPPPAVVPQLQLQVPYVGGQAPRRGVPGARRMTAS